MNLKDVFCPTCKKFGHKKLLFRTSENSKGVVVVWCKGCKKEVKIELDKCEREAVL